MNTLDEKEVETISLAGGVFIGVLLSLGVFSVLYFVVWSGFFRREGNYRRATQSDNRHHESHTHVRHHDLDPPHVRYHPHITDPLLPITPAERQSAPPLTLSGEATTMISCDGIALESRLPELSSAERLRREEMMQRYKRRKARAERRKAREARRAAAAAVAERLMLCGARSPSHSGPAAFTETTNYGAAEITTCAGSGRQHHLRLHQAAVGRHTGRRSAGSRSVGSSVSTAPTSSFASSSVAYGRSQYTRGYSIAAPTGSPNRWSLTVCGEPSPPPALLFSARESGDENEGVDRDKSRREDVEGRSESITTGPSGMTTTMTSTTRTSTAGADELSYEAARRRRHRRRHGRQLRAGGRGLMGPGAGVSERDVAYLHQWVGLLDEKDSDDESSDGEKESVSSSGEKRNGTEGGAKSNTPTNSKKNKRATERATETVQNEDVDTDTDGEKPLGLHAVTVSSALPHPSPPHQLGPLPSDDRSTSTGTNGTVPPSRRRPVPHNASASDFQDTALQATPASTPDKPAAAAAEQQGAAPSNPAATTDPTTKRLLVLSNENLELQKKVTSAELLATRKAKEKWHELAAEAGGVSSVPPAESAAAGLQPIGVIRPPMARTAGAAAEYVLDYWTEQSSSSSSSSSDGEIDFEMLDEEERKLLQCSMTSSLPRPPQEVLSPELFLQLSNMSAATAAAAAAGSGRRSPQWSSAWAQGSGSTHPTGHCRSPLPEFAIWSAVDSRVSTPAFGPAACTATAAGMTNDHDRFHRRPSALCLPASASAALTAEQHEEKESGGNRVTATTTTVNRSPLRNSTTATRRTPPKKKKKKEKRQKTLTNVDSGLLYDSSSSTPSNDAGSPSSSSSCVTAEAYSGASRVNPHRHSLPSFQRAADSPVMISCAATPPYAAGSDAMNGVGAGGPIVVPPLPLTSSATLTSSCNSSFSFGGPFAYMSRPFFAPHRNTATRPCYSYASQPSDANTPSFTDYARCGSGYDSENILRRTPNATVLLEPARREDPLLENQQDISSAVPSRRDRWKAETRTAETTLLCGVTNSGEFKELRCEPQQPHAAAVLSKGQRRVGVASDTDPGAAASSSGGSSVSPVISEAEAVGLGRGGGRSSGASAGRPIGLWTREVVTENLVLSGFFSHPAVVT